MPSVYGPNLTLILTLFIPTFFSMHFFLKKRHFSYINRTPLWHQTKLTIIIYHLTLSPYSVSSTFDSKMSCTVWVVHADCTQGPYSVWLLGLFLL